MDKERGMSLSQQHLLALKPPGHEVRDLEIFRRVEYVMSSLDTDEMPSESILRTWLYESLKSNPKLALKIDKYKEAAVGSKVQSREWLWNAMLDVIDESQHDANTASILATLKAKVDSASAAVAKDEKKKKNKKAESSTKEVNAAPLIPPKSPEPKQTPKAKPKASGTCRRDPCPFVHEGSPPKPKAKPKPTSSSNVAAAFAIAAGSLPSAKAMLSRFIKVVASSVALLRVLTIKSR